MAEDVRLTALFAPDRRNALIVWGLLVVFLGIITGGGLVNRYEPILFGIAAVVSILAPAVKFRDPVIAPPWPFVLLLSLPVLWETFAPQPLATPFIPGLALAALGLLLTVNLHLFTSLRLVPWFAVVVTVLFTLAMGGVLHVFRWGADVFAGTQFMLDGRSQHAINEAVMVELGFTTLAGGVAAVIFLLYMRYVAPRPRAQWPRLSDTPPHGSMPDESTLTQRIGVPLLYQILLMRGMQVLLVGLFAYGIYIAHISVVTNAAVALAITFLPVVLARNHRTVIAPGLGLWVATAVFLHTLGTAGLYDVLARWDNLTHTLSATVVAATGYAALRAIDLHDSRIHLPRWAMWGLILVFVLALGVLWELFEFGLDRLARWSGTDPVLAQHGIDDTIVDLLFDAIGAIIVATWGTIYLTEVSEQLATELDRRIGIR